MDIEETEIAGVLHVVPEIHNDERGSFMETYSTDRYADHGIRDVFVQDNLSRSAPGVLRGLHLQHPNAQAKLVSVTEGRVYDVAVDVRVGSPTFGAHVACVLDPERGNQLYIPAGFAHGFAVLGDAPAALAYKCTSFWVPEHEVTVLWRDPALGIAWPNWDPRLSLKDAQAPLLAAIDPLALPTLKQ